MRKMGKKDCSDFEILMEKVVFFELCSVVSDFQLVNYILNVQNEEEDLL